jgi:hypothetical protein
MIPSAYGSVDVGASTGHVASARRQVIADPIVGDRVKTPT